MSNQSYSKETVISEAVRSILIADTTNTGKQVREISHYLSNRVYKSYIEDTGDKLKLLPQINTEVESLGDEVGLPSSEYILTVKIFVNMDASRSKEILDEIATRVTFLLNKKEDDLNDATDKSLRCRLCIKYSSADNNDMLDKMIYGKNVIFSMRCDDEILDDL